MRSPIFDVCWLQPVSGSIKENCRIIQGPVFYDGKYWYEIDDSGKKRYGYHIHDMYFGIQESPIKGYMIMKEL